jgi:hypothetical protein
MSSRGIMVGISYAVLATFAIEPLYPQLPG